MVVVGIFVCASKCSDNGTDSLVFLDAVAININIGGNFVNIINVNGELLLKCSPIFVLGLISDIVGIFAFKIEGSFGFQ